ncbi:laminin subunit alpha-2 [Ditylenchus destructor]|nr:laminin subunit alpha-2 [Ditylenchus destructor]
MKQIHRKQKIEIILRRLHQRDVQRPVLTRPWKTNIDDWEKENAQAQKVSHCDESSKSKAEQLETDSQISSKEVVTVKQELETVHNEANIISHENSSLEEQMTHYEEMLEEWNAQKKEAEDEIATIYDRIRETNKLNENVVERLNTSLAKCFEELATAKEELAIEREKNADERHHFQLRLNAFEAENTERLRMEVDSLKELLDAAQNEHKQLSDENASLREKMTQYKDALQATDEHYKETLKERERKVTDLEQNLKDSEQLNAEISEELAKSNMNLDQVKKSNESLTEELKATKDKISVLETQTVQLTSQIENERAENSKENSCLKLRVRELESKNIEWTQDNKELWNANTLLHKQVKQYRGRFNRSDAQLRKLQAEYTSLLNMRRKVERDLSIKREEFEHLREKVARYRDTLKQRESKIFELDKNIQQSEQIRSSLSEELAKSNSVIQSTIVELERQRCENEKSTSVWKEQPNDIDEELNETEPVFQAESMGQPTNSSEYKARKRHSLDNDEENQDLRDSIKKPYLSPIPPDDLSRLPTPSNCEAALSNHGENDTTLPLLHLPMPAHEDVAMSDVGANGEITAQVIGRERSTESVDKICD